MWRWITAALVGAWLLGYWWRRRRRHRTCRGRRSCCSGRIGRNAGETPWELFREQLAMRGLPGR